MYRNIINASIHWLNGKSPMERFSESALIIRMSDQELNAVLLEIEQKYLMTGESLR